MEVDHYGIYLLGNRIIVWILAAGITLVVFYGMHVLTRLLSNKLPSRLKVPYQTKVLLTSVLKINPLLLVAIAVIPGLAVLKLPPYVDPILKRLLFVAICIQAGIWAVNFIWVFCVKSDGGESTSYKSSAHGLIVILSRIVIATLVVLVVLENWGVNISALVTGLGIGGVAIALAVQNVLGDVLASLSIVLDKPFELGDFIVMDDTMGTVEYIGIKTTRIRSLSGEQIILANSQLLAGRIRNFKRMYERRVVFKFGLALDTPSNKIIRILDKTRDVIQAQPKTRFERGHFKEFGDTALMCEVVYFVLSRDMNEYMDTQQRINVALKDFIESQDVEFSGLSSRVVIQGGNPQAGAAAANA